MAGKMMAVPVLSKKGILERQKFGALEMYSVCGSDGVFTCSTKTGQLMTNPKDPPGKDKLLKTSLEKDQTARFSWESTW